MSHHGKSLPVIVLLAAAIANAADGNRIWQIGKVDHDFSDLAHLSDINDYLKTYPAGTNFIVGKSDAAKDFVWIQPGPSDHWAGRREHPFKIDFELADDPAGVYVLQVHLLDVHGTQPPDLFVSINGHETTLDLKAGTGDITLSRPGKGQAQTWRFICRADELNKGKNRIELVAKKGSWVLYDAVDFSKLETPADMPISVSLNPTIFFRHRDGALKQEFIAALSGILSDEDIKLEVRTGDRVIDTISLRGASLGVINAPVCIEPAEEYLRELVVTASTSQQNGTITLTQDYQRRWRIYCAPSTHTDIGYTDLQDNVIRLHNRNTNLALQLADEFPLYHWNLESSWAAQMWLRDNPHYLHQKLYTAARNKRIGIESSYLNMLTGLCSTEELVRNLYYSARLHRAFGIPFESHTLTDAPSHVWGLPSVLAGAGIRYLSCGINQIRAPFLKKNIHHKSPFWWESPDGNRVLTWFTAGYSQAGRIGLKDGIERMRTAIEQDLHWWNHREDYPYDAVLLHGAYSDNVAIGRDIAESVTEYSRQYAYPQVVLCANNDFFEYIEAHFADHIPTVRGCGGSWWEDGAGSSAYETGVNRVTHQDIVAAEVTWASVVGAKQAPTCPQREFERIWDNILLYDEHTWGAHSSISHPTSDFVQRQWAVKAAYATDAEKQTDRLLDTGLRRLAGGVKAPDGSLLVFNPSSQKRTGVVLAEIPRDAVVMTPEGPLPQQLVKAGALKNVTVALLARDVPPVGYRTYTVAPNAGELPQAPGRFKENVLENDYYRVQFDTKTGGIASLIDKTLNQELVDQDSPYGFGQSLYVEGGEFKGHYTWWGPNLEKVTLHKGQGQSVEAAAAGPVFSSATSKAALKCFKGVELETILYEHERRIDFVVRMQKDMTYEREAVYVAFPFAGANPHFRYEVANATVRPNEDQIPGACRDWFSVQRWVKVTTDHAAVAWTPVDTPLITLCEMTPGKWLDELPISNGTIFAYVMNNYWFTNYKAGQDGSLTFRYSLTSSDAIDNATATQFGESVVQPMRTVVLHNGRKNKRLPAEDSFCQIEPETVCLSTMKVADDGKGIILRMQETAGRDTEVTVSAGLIEATEASMCDLVERVQSPLTISGGKLKFKINANGLATVRLQ